MISVSLSQASGTLPQLIEKTLKNSEETVIVGENGSVVMIDQEEWEHIRETLKLLQDKKSLRALLEGHKARDEGNTPAGISFDKAFHDL